MPRRVLVSALASAALVVSLAAATVLAAGLPAPGWTREDQTAKATFLFNLVKFTEWPADAMPPGTPLSICVVNDRGTLEQLRQIIGERPVNGRFVLLRWMAVEGPLGGCHVLYVEGDDERRSAEVIERVKASPILTIGETEDFATAGGVARVFIDHGRVRFVVNLAVAQRSRLYISSKVLALGVPVRN